MALACVDAMVMVLPLRSRARVSGASRRCAMAVLSFFCCPGGRVRVTRSAVVTGLSLRDGFNRYVPVRRFVVVVVAVPRPAWPYQSPRQSYRMLDTLLVRLSTTASYEK